MKIRINLKIFPRYIVITTVDLISRNEFHIKIHSEGLYVLWASLVAQRLKRLPPMQETWVQSLGREDTLEEGMATHSSILARRIPSTEKPGRLQSMGVAGSDMTE